MLTILLIFEELLFVGKNITRAPIMRFVVCDIYVYVCTYEYIEGGRNVIRIEMCDKHRKKTRDKCD